MAAFSALSTKLQEVFSRLKNKGKLNEQDVKEAMREVRLALLEADVNYKVVRDFIARVQEKAVGIEVLQSLTPAQQVIKIVDQELTGLMGGSVSRLAQAVRPPLVIMLVGLQGTGKTTTAGKLGKVLRHQGKKPLLVAADVYRPAAVKQLQVLGSQLEIPVFAGDVGEDPVAITKRALEQARGMGQDVVIIDTAGRLQINVELMDELRAIQAAVQPHEVLFVADAMAGQDAVNVAQGFHQTLELTGIILTKLDGDARGGAALSIAAVTGLPIKFAGVGEKLDALEPFHPDRMASRILGMGDVLSLIEKAQANMDIEHVREMEKKLRLQQFTLEDFLEQMDQVRSMGSLSDILGMLPGTGSFKQLKNVQVDEKELLHTKAIIHSMTPKERQHPEILNGSRKKRIAMGSGTRVQDVNRLLKQFEEARRLMRQFSEQTGKKAGKGKKGDRGIFNLPFMKH